MEKIFAFFKLKAHKKLETFEAHNSQFQSRFIELCEKMGAFKVNL